MAGEQRSQLGRKEGCSGVNGERAVAGAVAGAVAVSSVTRKRQPLQMPVQKCGLLTRRPHSRAAGNQ
jgi:hypothetical protein